MEFFKGFWRGLGQVLGYELFWRVSVADLIVGLIIISGAANTKDALFGGWFLAGVYWICLRGEMESSKGLVETMEDCVGAMQIATEVIESQNKVIEELRAALAATKTNGQ